MTRQDLSRSETTTYVCRCGTLYAADVWRRVDADARPELFDLVLRRGAVEGKCPACGTSARSGPTWLALYPSKLEARLMIDGSRRSSLIDEMVAHLQALQKNPAEAYQWLLQPVFDFTDRREETTARRSLPDLAHDDAEPELAARTSDNAAQTVPRDGWAGSIELGTPKPTTGHPSRPLAPLPDPAALFSEPFAPPKAEAPPESSESARPAGTPTAVPRRLSDPKSLEAGIPMVIGPDAAPPPVAAIVKRDMGAFVTGLSAEGGLVRVSVKIPAELLEQWEGAKIDVRPIHLRGRGYPLVGVRLAGMHFGTRGVVDAVVDPGHTAAAEVFRALSERFAVDVRFVAPARTVSRSVIAEGLEPNAALCLESARGLLARGEFPPEDFSRAKAALEAEGVAERLKLPTETIAVGAYQHIVGGAEATRALEHLDRVSQKESLARLLEVDGLPMAEYDAIRRRVLEGSLAHGLCAPRRFWRRLVASGLARDLGDYADKLAENRAEHDGEEGDLSAEESEQAWADIYDLCRRKDLPIPEVVRQALSLEEAEPDEEEDDELLLPPPRSASVAGEIRAGEISTTSASSGTQPGVRGPAATPDDLLRNPVTRLRAATDILQGQAHGDVDLVLMALEEFDTDELLAIMPDLSDLGPRAVPGLIAKLGSERREVRQASVILLGMSMEPRALDHLADHLVREPTTVWVDVARALGGFGPSAIRALCQILRREAGSEREALAIDRVSRALAEIALSDGDGARSRGGNEASGHAAVEALADAADPRVSTAARRALASLKDVKTSGAQIRGEIPLAEVTEVRGFARRAYEAIMVPELEVEAEA